MNLWEMKDEKLVSQITEDFTNANNNRRAFIEQSKENYRLYRSKIDEEKKREGANLFIPYTWATVEQLKARVWQAFFTKTPYVGYAGNSENDVDSAKYMEELVFWQMKEKIKFPFKFLQAVTSIFIYGTAIALYEWKYHDKVVKVKSDIKDPMTGAKIGQKIEEQNKVVWDDPNIEFIDIEDFYPDPEGWDDETCSYYITRVEKGSDYLRDMEKKGKYKLPENFENDSGQIVGKFRDEVNGVPLNKYGSDKRNKHEILSYYTDDYKFVMLNRRYIIAREENPNEDKKKPFIKGVAWDLPKEFWGESIVRVIQSLQEELNTTRNQRTDNVSLILNKVFKLSRGADIDKAQIKSKAGNIIELDNPNDLQVLDFPDVTRSAYDEEQIIKQDIQFVSSVSEYARGATPARKETATAISTLTESANIVFNYVTMIIETTLLLPVADAIKRLNQQYMQSDKVIRLFDAAANAWNFKTVNYENIQGDLDVVSTSPRFQAEKTKEAKRGQLLEMFTTFLKNPATAQRVNVPEFMKKIMDTYDIADYQKLISEPPPPQPPEPQIPPNVDTQLPPMGQDSPLNNTLPGGGQLPPGAFPPEMMPGGGQSG